MREIVSPPRAGVAAFVLAALALASVAPVATASSVAGASAPAASAVHATPQQPAHLQSDESASLRRGTVDAVAGQTQLMRNGKPASLDTLKAGEAIRFTVAPAGTAAPALKVIYAP